ncbi:hypothetical protein MFU01_72540 [Myxococcus fulvus]|uniref:Uncharacterized protein n=1 Tax=Myxococcus fulvus TaxID=33 RepID=A0A511TDH0_MYXFU|nr:hypothetical protein [Myxococcus fulvus]GEN12217.1 hypothetical protein MFU01_72540 [Myxococcus fulvus]
MATVAKRAREKWFSAHIVLVIVPKVRANRGNVDVWENIVLVKAVNAAAAKRKAASIGRLHARRSKIDADIEFRGVRAVVDVLPSLTGKAKWNEILESGAEVSCNKLQFSSPREFSKFMKMLTAKVELHW